MRELFFEPEAWEEFGWWVANDLKVVRKIYSLINSILKNPFEGLEKPEPLKADYAGYWSRRITEEHRLVYKVEATKIHIVQLKGHY